MCTDSSYGDREGYYSFNLYYAYSAAQWTCKSYFNANLNSTYFDVPDDDAEVSYGYST